MASFRIKIDRTAKKPKTPYEKRQRTNRIFSAIMGLIFLGSTFAAFAVPMITSNNQEESLKEQQELIERLQKQAEEEANNPAEPAEIDASLIVEGAVSELQIIDTVTGDGAEAELGKTIRVKYKGALAATGEVFDSNDQGVEFGLEEGRLIVGWTEGMPGMKVGGIRRLIIPSAKGYGPQGSPPSIPGDSDLVFDIELLEVK